MNTDRAASLAFFLLEQTGSTLGKWKGTMPAKAQRELFGQFLGKGMLVIDGSDESLRHIRKVGFGLDYDVTADLKWAAL